MADIFSVAPPAWLTELVTQDPAKSGTQAFQVGAEVAQRNRQLNIQERLGEKRIEAQKLMYEGRLQQMEQANTLAQMRLETGQSQLDLARQRLQLNQEAADRKSSDLQSYHGLWNRFTPDQRQELDQLGPNWLVSGPNTAQWNRANTLERDRMKAEEERIKSLGLTTSEVTIGPKGETTRYKPADLYGSVPKIIEPMPGQFFLQYGKQLRDLSHWTDTEKAQVRRAQGDYERSARMYDKVKNDPAVSQAAKDQALQDTITTGDILSTVTKGASKSLLQATPTQEHVLPGGSAKPTGKRYFNPSTGDFQNTPP